jgi:predicted nucleic acid-binding protein
VRYLLDVSVLLALLWENHVHHERVSLWEEDEDLAVCPITELGFLRISTQTFNASMEDACKSLSVWLAQRNPKFIPCDERVLKGQQAPSGGKTTDFYLAHLAQAHGMQLATLDANISHRAALLVPSPTVT